MSENKRNCIVWMDMELTGLNIETDTILEIACLITDQDLNVVNEEFVVVINQPNAILDNMNEWCTQHHTQTGLIEESRHSQITLKDAEQMLLEFLKKYIPQGTCPLAGNTIYMDRLFLMKFMPLVNSYLHYRIIDVSSIKELVRRWNQKISARAPKKKQCHRSLSDINESIQELKYYKDNIFSICPIL